MADLEDIGASLNALLTNYGVTRDQMADILGGSPDGGPNADGHYPVTLSNGATVLMQSFAAFLNQQKGSALGTSFVSLEQFGGKADYNGRTGTDNYPAFMAAIASLSYAPYNAVWTRGPTILLGMGSYYFSRTLEIKKIINMIGHGSSTDDFNGGTRLYFPADVAGIRCHTGDTLGDGVDRSNAKRSGEGSKFLGLKLMSGGGTNPNAHGFNMRGRAVLDIVVDGFPGDGVRIRASAGAKDRGDDGLEGNNNGWIIENLFVRDVGGHGLYINQNDSNAGVAKRVQIRSAGRCGIYESQTLGNTFGHIEIDDWDSKKVGGCTWNGKHYLFIGNRNNVNDVGVSGIPPVDGGNATWYEVETGTAGGFYPAYDNAKTYYISMPICCDGLSTRSSYMGAIYTEGGISDAANSRATIGTGQASWTRGTGFIRSQLDYGLTSGSGYSEEAQLPLSNPHAGSGEYTRFLRSGIGCSPIVGQISWHSRGADDNGYTRYSNYYDGDGNITYQFGYQSGRPYMHRYSGVNTKWQFGRAAPEPFCFWPTKLMLGDPNRDGANGARQVIVGPSPPTDGQWARGDTLILNNPVPGGNIGWTCITSGSPGLWAPCGNIELTANAAYAGGNVAANGNVGGVISVPGARIGDFVDVSINVNPQSLQVSAIVTADDNVRWRFHNNTTAVIAAAACTVKVRVRK